MDVKGIWTGGVQEFNKMMEEKIENMGYIGEST